MKCPKVPELATLEQSGLWLKLFKITIIRITFWICCIQIPKRLCPWCMRVNLRCRHSGKCTLLCLQSQVTWTQPLQPKKLPLPLQTLRSLLKRKFPRLLKQKAAVLFLLRNEESEIKSVWKDSIQRPCWVRDYPQLNLLFWTPAAVLRTVLALYLSTEIIILHGLLEKETVASTLVHCRPTQRHALHKWSATAPFKLLRSRLSTWRIRITVALLNPCLRMNSWRLTSLPSFSLVD